MCVSPLGVFVPTVGLPAALIWGGRAGRPTGGLFGSDDHLPNWSSQLAIEQFGLMFGAHLLQTYGGLARLREVLTRGLAPWLAQRAADVLRSRLDGGGRLNTLAQECGVSVSHFTRSLRATFGISAHQWLVQRRI